LTTHGDDQLSFDARDARRQDERAHAFDGKGESGQALCHRDGRGRAAQRHILHTGAPAGKVHYGNGLALSCCGGATRRLTVAGAVANLRSAGYS